MLRLVPLGWVGGGVGWSAAVTAWSSAASGWSSAWRVVGVGVGVCGEQLPLDTCSPLLAPAVWLTMLGTQLAASRV